MGQECSWDIGYQERLAQQAGETGRVDFADAIPLGLIDCILRGHRRQVAHFPELKEPVVCAEGCREENIRVQVDSQQFRHAFAGFWPGP